MPATEILEALEPYERLHESDYRIINKYGSSNTVEAKLDEEYPHITQQEATQISQYINDLEPDCS